MRKLRFIFLHRKASNIGGYMWISTYFCKKFKYFFILSKLPKLFLCSSFMLPTHLLWLNFFSHFYNLFLYSSLTIFSWRYLPCFAKIKRVHLLGFMLIFWGENTWKKWSMLKSFLTQYWYYFWSPCSHIYAFQTTACSNF